MLLILALFLLFGAAILVAEALTRPQRQRKASLARARAYADVSEASDVAASPGGAWHDMQTRLAPVALKLSPSTTLDAVSDKLVAAGLIHRLSPMSFLGSKVLLGAFGVLFGGAAAIRSGGSLRGIVTVVLFAIVLFLLPDLYLMLRRKARLEKISADLPNALDLLAVSVTAGLSFDAAIAKMADSLEGPVVEEFKILLGEMRVGVERRQALRNMAARVNLREMTMFTQAVIQSGELGTPLSDVLQVQAEDARTRRQAVAEEKAAKLPIKMIPPTAIFIFPVLFIVVLGPALLSLKDAF